MDNKEREISIRKAQYKVVKYWLKVQEEFGLKDMTLYDLVNYGFDIESFK